MAPINLIFVFFIWSAEKPTVISRPRRGRFCKVFAYHGCFNVHLTSRRCAVHASRQLVQNSVHLSLLG